MISVSNFWFRFLLTCGVSPSGVSLAVLEEPSVLVKSDSRTGPSRSRRKAVVRGYKNLQIIMFFSAPGCHDGKAIATTSVGGVNYGVPFLPQLAVRRASASLR